MSHVTGTVHPAQHVRWEDGSRESDGKRVMGGKTGRESDGLLSVWEREWVGIGGETCGMTVCGESDQRECVYTPNIHCSPHHLVWLLTTVCIMAHLTARVFMLAISFLF